MPITISLKIKESQATIEKRILRQYKAEVQSIITKAVPKITKSIKKLMQNAIFNSPEYQSLTGGDLQAEFGAINTGTAMQEVLNTWIDSLKIEVRRVRVVGSQLKGGFKITMIQGDYADVLSLASTSYRTEKGVEINWLDWLLLKGDRIIIQKYDVNFRNAGRTGGAVMVSGRGKNYRVGRVSPGFSGTASDNFVTRSLKFVESDIERMMEKHIVS